MIRSATEEEAKEKVEKLLGFPIPEFYYLPSDMTFEKVRVDSDTRYAKFQYICKVGSVYLTVSGSETDGTESLAPDVSKVETIPIKLSDESILVYVTEDTTGEQGTVIYRAQWIYHNCQYELSGAVEKEEMIKILEKMRYTM